MNRKNFIALGVCAVFLSCGALLLEHDGRKVRAGGQANGVGNAVAYSNIANMPPTYTSPAIDISGLVSYGTQRTSMGAPAVTAGEAFECGVANAGTYTPTLTSSAYVTTAGTLNFAVTNSTLAALPGSIPTINAVCRPLN